MNILLTPLCRVEIRENKLIPFIKLSDGGWLEHNAFDSDLRGYIGVLMLAQDVLAGKFYPKRIVKEFNKESLLLDSKPLQSMEEIKMGTRNLTIMKLGKKVVAAQYGQWDGYPSGVGKDIAEALQTLSIPKIKENLQRSEFLSDEDVSKLWKNAGADDSGLVSFKISEIFEKLHPELHRNTSGGKLLKILAKRPCKLSDASEFGKDGVFCEYAYTIDFDKKTVKVQDGGTKGKTLKIFKFKDCTPAAMEALEEK